MASPLIEEEICRLKLVARCGLFLAALYRHHPEHAPLAFLAAQVRARKTQLFLAPAEDEAPILVGPIPVVVAERAISPVSTIIRAAAVYYQTTVGELLSRRVDKTTVRARHVAMYLAKKMTNTSFPRIGERIGGRDHTTVMHGCAKIEAMLADPDGDALLPSEVAGVRALAVEADPALGIPIDERVAIQ